MVGNARAANGLLQRTNAGQKPLLEQRRRGRKAGRIPGLNREAEERTTKTIAAALPTKGAVSSSTGSKKELPAEANANTSLKAQAPPIVKRA
jgi:hypothetical protein